MTNQEKNIARRDWLVALGRYVTLTGILALVGTLVARSPGHCSRLTAPCHDCGLLAHCRRPNAATARQRQRAEGKG